MKKRRIVSLMLAVLVSLGVGKPLLAGAETAINTHTPVAEGFQGIAYPVKDIFAGGYVSFLIDANDALWAWGGIGRIGIGDNPDAPLPEKVMESVRAVTHARGHTLVIKTDGSLWACGKNTYGQLGDGTREFRDSFVRIMDNVDKAYVSLYHDTSFAIKKDHTLWMWGEKMYFLNEGETGHNAGIITSPMAIAEEVVQLALGENVALIQKTDGLLYVQGISDYSLTKDVTKQTYSMQPCKFKSQLNAFRAAFDEYFLFLDDKGTLTWYGKVTARKIIKNKPAKVLTDVVMIEMMPEMYTRFNYCASFAMQSDGTLWAWGDNMNSGQLGEGSHDDYETPVKILEGVSKIAVGLSHGIALKHDGTIWTWGLNHYGQIGNGNVGYNISPSQVMEGVSGFSYIRPRYYVSIQKDDGSIWSTSGEEKFELISEEPIKGYFLGSMPVDDTDYGEKDCVYILKQDDTLWCRFINEEKNLGGGAAADRSEPFKILDAVKDVQIQKIRWNYNYALTKDGKLYRWGRIDYKYSAGDQYIYGKNWEQILTPSLVPIQNVKKMCFEEPWGETIHVLTDDGTLWGWGNNDEGLVGNGKKEKKFYREPVKILSGVKDVSNDGPYITQKFDGTLYAWGTIFYEDEWSRKKPTLIAKDVMDYYHF